MIVVEPRGEDRSQMTFPEDNKVVQDLVFGALHPCLRMGIHIRRPGWNRHELNAVGLQDRTKLGGEFTVPVADDVRRPRLRRLLGKDHAHVPCNLGHPNTIGIGRHARKMNAPRMDVNKKQHVIGHRTAQRPNGLRKEICGPKRLDVPFDELVPSAFASLWSQIKSVFLQNPGYCGSGDSDAQFLQFPKDPLISPTGVSGHLQDQVPNFFRYGRAAWFARLDFLCRPLGPALKRPVADNRNQFLNFPSKAASKFDQLGPFCGRDFNSFGQLGTENLVLRFQVLDHFHEFLFRSPSNQQQEGMDKSGHASKIRKYRKYQEMTTFWDPATTVKSKVKWSRRQRETPIVAERLFKGDRVRTMLRDAIRGTTMQRGAKNGK
jgi:hypothetical protein